MTIDFEHLTMTIDFDRVKYLALLELETRARRTGRETSDCNSRARLGRGSPSIYDLADKDLP